MHSGFAAVFPSAFFTIVTLFCALAFAISTESPEFVAKEHPTFVAAFIGLFSFIVILQLLVTSYLVLVVMRQCLYLVRGGSGFQRNLFFLPRVMYLKMLGLSLILVCVICLPFLPVMFISHSSLYYYTSVSFAIAIIVAILVCFLLTTWLAIRLCLSIFFIVDQNTGIIESMRYSWQVSYGNFWLLLFSSYILSICAWSGTILWSIGSVLTTMIALFGSVLIYLQLTGQPNCLDAPPILPLPVSPLPVSGEPVSDEPL